MNVQDVVAYCGLTCKSCPIYWVTREEDEDKRNLMRERIARLCNEHYGLSYTREDITDCDGCRTESGRLFSGCHHCEIRACARERNFTTCAQCQDYVCDKLQKLYATDPTGKIWLDIIKDVY